MTSALRIALMTAAITATVNIVHATDYYTITGPGAVISARAGNFYDFPDGPVIGKFAEGRTYCAISAPLPSAPGLPIKLPNGHTVYAEDGPEYFRPAPSGLPQCPTVASAQKESAFNDIQQLWGQAEDNPLTKYVSWLVVVPAMVYSFYALLKHRRASRPLSTMTQGEIQERLNADAFFMAQKVRRELNVGSADVRQALLDHIRPVLVAYGTNRVPGGTLKPLGRQVTREKVLAARAYKKAQAHESAARRAAQSNKPAPPQNTSPQTWELELSDWFADLVMTTVNAQVFPVQAYGQPFGPEHAGGQAAVPMAAAQDDLSYKPNT